MGEDRWPCLQSIRMRVQLGSADGARAPRTPQFKADVTLCEESNSGVCARPGSDSRAGVWLWNVSCAAWDMLSWGQAAVGTCHSNVNKNKEEHSVNITLLSGCDWIHWFMRFRNR